MRLLKNFSRYNPPYNELVKNIAWSIKRLITSTSLLLVPSIYLFSGAYTQTIRGQLPRLHVGRLQVRTTRGTAYTGKPPCTFHLQFGRHTRRSCNCTRTVAISRSWHLFIWTPVSDHLCQACYSKGLCDGSICPNRDSNVPAPLVQEPGTLTIRPSRS